MAEPPSKKRALEESGGAVVPDKAADPFLLPHQHAALSAKFRAQKEELRRAHERVAALEEQERRSNAAVASVAAHWSQIEDVLRAAKPEAFEASAGEAFSGAVTALTAGTIAQHDDELARRSRILRSVAASALSSSNCTGENLERFIRETGRSVSLEASHQAAERERDEAKARAGTLAALVKRLEFRLERLDGGGAAAAAAAAAAAPEAKAVGLVTSAGTSVKKEPETSGESGKPAANTSAAPPESDAERAEREAEISGLREALQKSEAKVEELLVNIAKATAKLENHETQGPSEEAVQGSPAYVALQAHLAHSKQDIAAANAQVTSLQQQLQTLREDTAAHRATLQESCEARVAELHGALERSRADISDLRQRVAEQDAELERLRSAQNQHTTASEFQKLLEQSNREIERLRAQVARSEKSSAEDVGAAVLPLDSAANEHEKELQDSLSKARDRIKQLEKSLAQATPARAKDEPHAAASVPSASAAPSSAVAPSSSAGAGDAILSSDVNVLRAELQRVRAVLEGNEVVRKHDKLKERFNSLLHDLQRVKAEKKALESKYAKADKTAREAQKKINEVSLEKESLFNEINEVVQDNADLREQNSRLLGQSDGSDEMQSQIYAEQARMLEQKSVLISEVQQLQRTLDQYRADLESCNTAIEQHVRFAQELQARTDALERENAALESCVSDLRSHISTLEARATDAEIKAASESEKLSSFATRHEHDSEALAKAEALQGRLRSQIATLEKKVVRMRGGKGDALESEEFRYMRKKIVCQVCNQREKSCVITNCYHTFCRDCIDENLRIRHRKCPACGKAFSGSDVKDIFLVQ